MHCLQFVFFTSFIHNYLLSNFYVSGFLSRKKSMYKGPGAGTYIVYIFSYFYVFRNFSAWSMSVNILFPCMGIASFI